MQMNRRIFLAASAALFLQACAGFPVVGKSKSPKKSRYFVPSPGRYLGKRQDFSGIRFDHRISAKRVGIEDGYETLLSVVDDDGAKVRRLSIPGNIHQAVVEPDLTFLVSVDKPVTLQVIETDSFDLVAAMRVRPRENFSFGGHLVPLPDGKHIAVTMNNNVAGKFDSISIRDRNTLKEVDRVSSYGFEIHDIALSNDGKSVFAGHYGSYLGSGPYKNLAEVTFAQVMAYKRSDEYYNKNSFKLVHPACISQVDLASGKLIDRQSYQLNGEQGHLAVGLSDSLYVPKNPTLVRARPDSLTHPAFQEGPPSPEWAESFVPKAAAFGTTVVYDAIHGQILVPSRYDDKLLFAHESRPDEIKEVNLKKHIPDLVYPHALCLHPDGQTYAISANSWFASFERGSHRFIPQRSFPIELFVHSHIAAL